MPDMELVSAGWAPGFRIRVKPELAVQELDALEDENGTISVDDVVERAQDEDNPLHRAFTWDNTKAADMHRRDEARRLLRSLVVVYRRSDGTETPPVNYAMKVRYVRSLDASKSGRTVDPSPEGVRLQLHSQPRMYTTSRTLADDAYLRQRVISQAWQELKSFQKKYEHFTEFDRLFALVEELASTG